jgi:predicted GH43/DUF377 family glycosyl hydrolase
MNLLQSTRRSFLGSLASATLALPSASPDLQSYQTPYKLGKLVLAASNKEGAFDSQAVDCPFVFSYKGSFYMTYVGFDGIGYQTGLASSSDLVTWKREDCILRRDPSSPITRYNIAMNWIIRENGLRSPGALKRVKGHFLGAYHAYPSAGYEQGPAVIGLCWSDNLRNWQLEDPCLRSEDGADWERGGLYKPCLLEHSGTYYLFYNAKTEEKRWHEQSGVAISRDLKTWQRFSGNPLIHNGTPDTWDDRFASDPCVVLNGKTWAFFYFGLDSGGKARDLLALGKDPFHFEKAHEILIDVGPPGSVDSTYAHKPSVIFYKGALYHFYCAVSGSWPHETRGISVARSKPW